jgi:hypothetical protein
LDPDPHPDPHHFGNLDPYPDLLPLQGDKPDPDPRKLKLGIRIKVISRIRNTVVDCSRKCFEKSIKVPYHLGRIRIRTISRIRIRIKRKVGPGSGFASVSNKNQDPYPHQSDADPQHLVTK